jgi:hypothetical protein
VTAREPVEIPFIPESDEGLIYLGPSNKGAVTRLAIYAQQIIDSGRELPPSPFCEWAADRVCGEDRQDLVIFLQGRRGSGKSYSALYFGKRLGEAIAKRKGGTWKDYFSMDNCATLEDTENVLMLTNSAKKYQVILIDDCSIAISNRSWNSQQNRNFNALLSVCRTKRWIMILTAPLKKHVDNQTREMCDINMGVWKSFHKGGFNVIKATSAYIGALGKEYSYRLNFFKKKVNFWVAFKPDADLVKDYDKKRDESVTRLNAKIVDTGRYDGTTEPEKLGKSRTEVSTERAAKEKGDKIRDYLIKNPDASLMDLSCETGLSQQPLRRVLYSLGIKLQAKRKRSGK